MNLTQCLRQKWPEPLGVYAQRGSEGSGVCVCTKNHANAAQGTHTNHTDPSVFHLYHSSRTPTNIARCEPNVKTDSLTPNHKLEAKLAWGNLNGT